MVTELLSLFFPAIATTLFFFAFVLSTQHFHRDTNRYFQFAAIFNLLLILCDFLKNLFINLGLSAKWQALPYAWGFIFRIGITMFVSFIALRHAKHRFGQHFLLVLPFLLNVLCVWVSLFTPFVFYTKNDVLCHGTFYFIPFVISVLYLGILVYMTVINYIQKDFADLLGILICLVSVGIATAMEAALGYVGVLSGAASVSLVFYYMILHNSTGARDGLTGLFGRARFYRDLPEIKCTAVLVADINGLKKINDVDGHVEGDKAIATVAEILRDCQPAHSFTYRTGGDEFVVLYTSAQTEETIGSILESLHNGLEWTPYTCAFGYALAQSEMTNTDVLHAADECMYRDKAAYKTAHPVRTGAVR